VSSRKEPDQATQRHDAALAILLLRRRELDLPEAISGTSARPRGLAFVEMLFSPREQFFGRLLAVRKIREIGSAVA
jgi:hypothetical protein